MLVLESIFAQKRITLHGGAGEKIEKVCDISSLEIDGVNAIKDELLAHHRQEGSLRRWDMS